MADHLSVKVWVSPGRAECVARVRRWAQSLAAAWGAGASDTGLVVSELVTNALVHTRSGQSGGTVAVVVAGGWDSVTVHVHDLGTGGGQVHRPRLATADAAGPVEGGRGLPIVSAISAEWGSIPAALCPVRGLGDPAAEVGGCCTWCRLTTQPNKEESSDA